MACHRSQAKVDRSLRCCPGHDRLMKPIGGLARLQCRKLVRACVNAPQPDAHLA